MPRLTTAARHISRHRRITLILTIGYSRRNGRWHQMDKLAKNSYRKVAALNPGSSAYHDNLGLFFKARGKFEEGMKSNQTAASLVDEAVDPDEWNLGICASA
jgi:Tfp pilus assembly protein PilF